MTEAQRKKFRRGLAVSIVVIALGGVAGIEIGLYNASMQKVQLLQQQAQLLQTDAADMQHEVDMAEVAAFQARHPTSCTRLNTTSSKGELKCTGN